MYLYLNNKLAYLNNELRLRLSGLELLFPLRLHGIKDIKSPKSAQSVYTQNLKLHPTPLLKRILKDVKQTQTYLTTKINYQKTLFIPN